MNTYKRYCLGLLLPLLILPIITGLSLIGSFFYETFQFSGLYFLINLEPLYFHHLPLLLAASVTFFLTLKMDGTSILSGIISYIVVTQILTNDTFQKALESTTYQLDPTFVYIQTPFIGILCGIISAWIYNHFSSVQLPQGFAFFSGKRLVPIITGCIMIFISSILFFTWPYIVEGLITLINGIKQFHFISDGWIASIQKLLTPIGFSLLPMFDIESQAFLSSITMYITPIVLIIVYLHSNKQLKNLYLSLFIMIFLNSIVGGNGMLFDIIIFMSSPILYGIHIFLTGLLIIVYNNSSIPIPLLGIGASIAYGVIFYTLFQKLNIHFDIGVINTKKHDDKTVQNLFHAFGGIENIIRFQYLPNLGIEVFVISISFVDMQKFQDLGFAIPYEKEANILILKIDKDGDKLTKALEELQKEEMQSLVF
ncbi:phosphotransferase system glucose/maltose/N-acetylglucosamine-specific IIC component [Breznakia sp. PF5-3]|uniref:PTS transporter subunit EIIC n=1 Tax=unclassified Breznakia TaxID=2623764 RepID=UPI0024070FA5|nr:MULTISPECIES: PTS transporter subunit EIIC [unclassified Breznakia]MDF9824021.1 phosphotransferase system glucose/maltose/N-acetylglucosamine-specific IIC component [Breznakia sp. PM6-1]MDF9834820.1 phosphotransferase system glucose/maltose/N-acetylglucosamine-specific IIC component [Breznakia sp. PF5-3]MDF9838139.1 phosphotransferase system glucose/maltose/N-acetylglucosamine-specific IIC component [Breznakia sp. PFB2-8]MDF9860125.1 phosphotransferase system glucose/maltose/N-acetylglucosam